MLLFLLAVPDRAGERLQDNAAAPRSYNITQPKGEHRLSFQNTALWRVELASARPLAWVGVEVRSPEPVLGRSSFGGWVLGVPLFVSCAGQSVPTIVVIGVTEPCTELAAVEVVHGSAAALAAPAGLKSSRPRNVAVQPERIRPARVGL